jgi:hypothetical protein
MNRQRATYKEFKRLFRIANDSALLWPKEHETKKVAAYSIDYLGEGYLISGIFEDYATMIESRRQKTVDLIFRLIYTHEPVLVEDPVGGARTLHMQYLDDGERKRAVKAGIRHARWNKFLSNDKEKRAELDKNIQSYRVMRLCL